MTYTLIGIDGNEVNQHDLQDKGVWCTKGFTKEEAFVRKFGEGLGLTMNPRKKVDPYVPDLVEIPTGHVADLKTQNTPFFKAGSLYGLDPQYTVVFNGKDRLRYRELYPDIVIYFAVDWQVVRFRMGKTTIDVKPMVGVWRIPFQGLLGLLDETRFHTYQQRVHDIKGNAKGSYVLDIQHERFERVV